MTMKIKSIVFFEILDLVKFVMCTLVSRDFVPCCKYMKRQVYLGNQGTHDKLNQMRIVYSHSLVTTRKTPHSYTSSQMESYKYLKFHMNEIEDYFGKK